MLPSITPRNYKSTGGTLRHDLAVMLRDHPEAFDCLIFPALESEHDEITAVNAPVATLLDREARRQNYGDPIKARAMVVPDEALAFETVDSGLYESFLGASQSMDILLSEPGVRTFSLVQWLEYTESDNSEAHTFAGAGDNEPSSAEPSSGQITRTLYVASTRPLGRTLGAGVAHVCMPLPALGEIPELTQEQVEPDDGEQSAESDPQAQSSESANAGQCPEQDSPTQSGESRNAEAGPGAPPAEAAAEVFEIGVL